MKSGLSGDVRIFTKMTVFADGLSQWYASSDTSSAGCISLRACFFYSMQSSACTWKPLGPTGFGTGKFIQVSYRVQFNFFPVVRVLCSFLLRLSFKRYTRYRLCRLKMQECERSNIYNLFRAAGGMSVSIHVPFSCSTLSSQ